MNSVVRLRVVAASHILLFLVLIFLLTRIATGTVAAAERFQPMADIGRHGISLPAVQQPVCITRVLHQEMKRQRLVGLAVGISRNGHPVYVGGHGWADRESRTRVTNDTLFRWASLSKTLTAFAVMQQWEQGRLDIDADVRTYVPEYPPKSSVVTARQLLSHRGGLVRHTRYTRLDLGDNNNDSNNNVLHALDAFKAYPLRSTPSKAYAYSTYGYILLSAMVRRAARMPYPEYIQQHIARPFSLHTLQPDEHPHKDPHEATGYRIHRKPIRRGRHSQGPHIVRSPDTDVSWKLGGGGYMSTVGDLMRWGNGIVSQQVVHADTLHRMLYPVETGRHHYAYGLRHWSYAKQRLTTAPANDVEENGHDVSPVRFFGHQGMQRKTKTLLLMEPTQRLVIALMSNSEWADLERVAERVVGVMGRCDGLRGR